MVGNLEITAKKTEKMVGTRLRLVHHTKGYAIQSSSKSVALLKILN